MAHRQYTSQYKTRIVLEVLQGEKELGEIAAENNLNPNMVRNWKREFLENASTVFEDLARRRRRQRRRKPHSVKRRPGCLRPSGS